MRFKEFSHINYKNWNYIINGRKGAIVISKENIIAAYTHNDCLDILFREIPDEEIPDEEINKIEKDISMKNSSIPLLIGDLYEKAIVLYYYDYIDNRKIRKKLTKYCSKNNLKIFLNDSLFYK